MITKITGKLLNVNEDAATLGIDAFEYEVLIPDFVRRQLAGKLGETISLQTIHYFDGDPSRGRVTPRLVGFLNVVEREFFELFCSVDGVGAKKALRAMVRPVKEIAEMVEDQDAKGLSTLPGIGPSTAERMIAKLRRKMSKFALMVSASGGTAAEVPRDIVQETFSVLCTLGHTESAARHLLDNALKAKKKYPDVESLLNAIFQQSHDGEE